jgi:hypothetical protein
MILGFTHPQLNIGLRIVYLIIHLIQIEASFLKTSSGVIGFSATAAFTENFSSSASETTTSIGVAGFRATALRT